MKVLPPQTITTAMVATSSIAEPDPNVYTQIYTSGNTTSGPEVSWAPSTGYTGATTTTTGTYVIRNTTHLVYECLVSHTSGADTSENWPENNIEGASAKWAEVGPTNKYAIFDALRNSLSYGNTTMSWTITPGEAFDSIVFMDIYGVSSINIVTSGTVTDNQTYSITNRTPTNWGSYFLTEPVQKDKYIITGLTKGAVTVVITFTGGTDMRLGAILFGSIKSLGTTQRQIASDVINFSTVNRDAYGNATMTARRNISKINAISFIDQTEVDNVSAIRDNINGTPAVWLGLDSVSEKLYSTLFLYGFYRNFSINTDNPISALITLEIEEL